MRELKFRIYCKRFRMNRMLPVTRMTVGDDGTWFHGNDGNSRRAAIHSSTELVMQYTGLKDKNGVEIYEGDILSVKKDRYVDGAYYPMQHGHHPENARVVEWAKVSWHEGFFVDARPIHEYMFFNRAKTEAEVIGNIHENPELLEVSNAATS